MLDYELLKYFEKFHLTKDEKGEVTFSEGFNDELSEKETIDGKNNVVFFKGLDLDLKKLIYYIRLKPSETVWNNRTSEFDSLM